MSWGDLTEQSIFYADDAQDQVKGGPLGSLG